ncbi:helix-turn-helix transcriptional regulator [Cellulomonas fengjieae]|uniref:WYL domain-containing protein n=1 Tax=Cellulomonas fengjieae TaxID=2819978 RepID=A0ABS3SFL2_9CELL|nr:WYL domain-containing protein [Cellulomonas fengjieae]MBO3083751.1 WYL domain-containing protein [Cellulomonas fengjieae]QVI64953.1 WYL domain-containing protein [Cellulomonas fengjieae]
MAGDRSPTARALTALELIQDSPGITAERLAERLGVSERAARRYVAILREAEIPIDSVRGPYGGYRVGRGLRPPPVVFTAAEALALVMAALDGHHDADDVGTPVGSALGKVVRSLPESVAAPVRAVRHGTAPAPGPDALRPDPATAAALVQARAAHRRVRLAYRSENGNAWEAVVDPWAVVVRHGRWYLLCYSHGAQARRAFRVDRIGGVEPRAETFSLPAGLDPVAELEAHLAQGWEFEVVVEVRAPAHRARAWLPPDLGRLEAVDGSSCRLVGTTSNPYWIAERLAAVPVPIRVVGGPELHATVRSLGRHMLAATEAPPRLRSPGST